MLQKVFDILDLFIFISFHAWICTNVAGQKTACTDGDTVGPDQPRTFAQDLDKDQGYGYVLYGDLYKIKCCGVIRTWEFSVLDNAEVELQIWRPIGTDNNQFKLVGYNLDTVTRKDRKEGYVRFEVEERSRISVEENDVIGWHAPLDSLIGYNDGTEYEGVWKLKHDTAIDIGAIVDFSTGTHQNLRTYGIQAILAPNSPPLFDPVTIKSISKDVKAGTSVYQIKAKDSDSGHGDDMLLEMVTESDNFAFDALSGILSVKKEFTVTTTTDYTLDFRVQDHCDAEDKTTLTIKVTADTTTTTTEATTTDIREFYTDEPAVAGNDTQNADDGSAPGWMIGVIVAVVVVVVIIVAVVAVIIINKKTNVMPAPRDPEKRPTRKPGKNKNKGDDKENKEDNKTKTDDKPKKDDKPKTDDKVAQNGSAPKK